MSEETQLEGREDIVDHEAQRFGYPSARAFIQALDDFRAAHRWALTNVTFASILLKCGPSMEIARTNPQLEIFTFRLRCKPIDPANRPSRSNPANTFGLEECGFSSFFGCTLLGLLTVKSSTDVMNECKIAHEEQAKKDTPSYVGTIPILYAIPGLTFRKAQLVSIHRPTRVILMTDPMRMALQDFIRFCINSVNGGFPLHLTDPRRPYHPVPGLYTRTDRQWAWKALFARWDEYQKDKVCDPQAPSVMLAGLETGLLPVSLLDVYAQFWAIDGDEEKHDGDAREAL